MPAIEIRPDIYWIGVNDRTTDLFEGMWPITEEGVSYNSYLILDEKKALIDITRNTQEANLLAQLQGRLDCHELDYIVVNHMEPDHTGALRVLRSLAPQATILCSAKAQAMLKDYYGITDNVQVVADGETLSLGKHQLQFHMIPFVHWPETMATYETTEKVLFSCDAFGGYGALRGSIFDDQAVDLAHYEREALRYYVNIVARFSQPTLNAIKKLGGIEIAVVAPSHGLIWRRDTKRIIELYRQWALLATNQPDPGVTLIYGSMYGNTEAMMNAVAQGISRAGVPVEIFNAARTHASYILPSVWTHSGVMIGAPTYEVGLFTPMAEQLRYIIEKRISNRKAAFFGSYGWSGGALKTAKQLVEPLKWEWVETLEFQGRATLEQLAEGEAFGYRFAESLKPQQGVIPQ
ncbi:MAG: FprA family A-type flavoprotein [Chloroflexi bacterium]|nr:FprA family A-type flavoprotein [Chloroflexota bacterium]